MKKTLIFLLYFICILLVILDVFYNKKDLHSNIEKIPLIFAFSGFFLFIAFICLTDWIGKKISSIKDDVLTKLQKNKNSG